LTGNFCKRFTAFHSLHLSTGEGMAIARPLPCFSLHKKGMKHVLTGTVLAVILLCFCAVIAFISPAL